VRTYDEALAFARDEVKNPSKDWYNLCQMFSRRTFGAAAWAPSAREAFNATPAAHRHTSWPPPAGSIAYWGNAHTGAGHATPILDTAYSNDIYRHGKIDPVKLTPTASQMPFVTKWGLPFRGWIDTTPSGPIPTPPAPPSLPVVKVSDLLGARAYLPSTSGRLVNLALRDEGYLPASLVRSYFGPRAQAEFRRWRGTHGFGLDTRAALVALGAIHDFTVL
jgi:hypothetical protein